MLVVASEDVRVVPSWAWDHIRRWERERPVGEWSLHATRRPGRGQSEAVMASIDPDGHVVVWATQYTKPGRKGIVVACWGGCQASALWSRTRCHRTAAHAELRRDHCIALGGEQYRESMKEIQAVADSSRLYMLTQRRALRKDLSKDDPHLPYIKTFALCGFSHRSMEEERDDALFLAREACWGRATGETAREIIAWIFDRVTPEEIALPEHELVMAVLRSRLPALFLEEWRSR